MKMRVVDILFPKFEKLVVPNKFTHHITNCGFVRRTLGHNLERPYLQLYGKVMGSLQRILSTESYIKTCLSILELIIGRLFELQKAFSRMKN